MRIETGETFFYRIPSVYVGDTIANDLADLDSFDVEVTDLEEAPLVPPITGVMTPRAGVPGEWESLLTAPETAGRVRINAVARLGDSEASWTTYHWIFDR